MVPPVIGLLLKVSEVVKRPQREKVVPDVMDGALFHLPFFMRASDIAGIRDNGKRTKKRQKGLIEAYERPVTFYNSCEHIIGNQLSGGSLKESESVEETPMQGLLPLRVGKFQVKQPTIGFNNRHTIKSSFCIAVWNGTEVSPVNLALMTWR
jgi:hypothetical protein